MRAILAYVGLLASLTAGCTAVPEDHALTAAQPAADSPPEGLARLAADIEAHGETGTALVLYRQAAEQTGDASDYVRLGNAYARARRTNQAIDAFRLALRREPNNRDALQGLGVALARKPAATEAIANSKLRSSLSDD